MTISIKLAYDGKYRRDELYVEEVDLTISLLMDTAKNLFPSLEEIDGEKLSFEYYDKDGDVITYAQKELKVALNEMRGGDLLKFEIITILKSHPKVTAFDEENYPQMRRLDNMKSQDNDKKIN